MKRIIYDIGANNGDDVAYYLKKCDLVVAVEANPVLCDLMTTRYSDAIQQGRLAIENIVLTDEKESGEVCFYRHKHNDGLSQFPRPSDTTHFETIHLPSKSVMQLLSEYGDPYYIKIDVEHYDTAILRSLFEHQVRPPFISAESHSIDTFALLVALGGYRAFKIIEGELVSERYGHHPIHTHHGIETHAFTRHSAGPFGDDIPGDWMTPDHFHRLLGLAGVGWRDIHASNVVMAADTLSVSMWPYFKKACYDTVIRKIKAPARILRSMIYSMLGIQPKHWH